MARRGLDEADVRRFDGEEGLRRLRPHLVVDVDDRAAFRATVVRAAFDSTVEVEAVSLSPVRSLRPHRERADAPHSVTMHMLLHGSYEIIGDGDQLVMEAGDAAVLDTRIEARFRSTEAVRLLKATIRLDELPPHIRDEPPLPFGALRSTILIDAYRAFLRAVLDGWSGDQEQAPHLVRGLEDLTVGVLTEASGAQEHRRGADAMRFHIKDQIEQRLADPHLSAVTIAAALGVSARHVHKTFEKEGVTIARYIQERRLRATAADLRTQLTRARSSLLAPRHGFGGGDQLSRAFRRRYGVTLEEYRQNSHLYRL